MTIRLYEFFDNTSGMNLQANAALLKSSEAEDIVNMHLTPQGAWSTQNVGFTVINSAALNEAAPINGVTSFQKTDGTAWLLVAAGSKLYEMNPGDGSVVEIGSDLSASALVSFVTFQNMIILCNGADVPKKWLGSGSLLPLDGWPPHIDGINPGPPAFSEVFANRLVMAGDPQNPSTLYISALEDSQQFTPTSGPASAGSIQVIPGDGDRITGLKTLYLPLDNQEVLVVFKQHSTYLMQGQDATDFSIQKISETEGAVSHRSIVVLGTDVLFLSPFGVSSLNTTTLQGNIALGRISQSITTQINRLNRRILNASFAVYIPERQEIWWFVAEEGSTQNRRILVYRLGYAQGAWSRRDGITATCAAVVNKRLYTGTYEGHIHQQIQGNSYAGAPIDWTYRTPFYAFGQQRLNKRIREIELVLRLIAPSQVQVKGAWNDARTNLDKQVRDIQVSFDAQTALYNTATYGAARYSVAGTARKRFVFDGQGQRFQLEFSGSQTSNATEIEGWVITTIDGGFSS